MTSPLSRRDDDVIKPWDCDHTALVHVLWDARREGLSLEHDADQIASNIMRSKWMRAARQQAVGRAMFKSAQERQ